jgi:hypothetical protein
VAGGVPPTEPPPRPPLMPATVAAGLASVTECLACGNPIRTMAFRFTGVCCGNCQKELAERNLNAEMDVTVVLP